MLNLAVFELDQLGAAAADVDEHAALNIEVVGSAHEIQPGFLLAGEHFGPSSHGIFQGGLHFFQVVDVPQRSGGDDGNLIHFQVLGQLHKAADLFAAFFDASLIQSAFFHISGQTGHALFVHQHIQLFIFVTENRHADGVGAYIYNGIQHNKTPCFKFGKSSRAAFSSFPTGLGARLRRTLAP